MSEKNCRIRVSHIQTLHLIAVFCRLKWFLHRVRNDRDTFGLFGYTVFCTMTLCFILIQSVITQSLGMVNIVDLGQCCPGTHIVASRNALEKTPSTLYGVNSNARCVVSKCVVPCISCTVHGVICLMCTCTVCRTIQGAQSTISSNVRLAQCNAYTMQCVKGTQCVKCTNECQKSTVCDVQSAHGVFCTPEVDNREGTVRTPCAKSHGAMC